MRQPYVIETGFHYTIGEDSLEDAAVHTGPLGQRLLTGTNRHGFRVTLPLDAPLCEGCDGQIIRGVCHDCQIIHADLPAGDFIVLEAA